MTEPGVPQWLKQTAWALSSVEAGAPYDDLEPLKKVLADGVKRAGTLEGPIPKAWALRDAFDGVLDVIGRKMRR